MNLKGSPKQLFVGIFGFGKEPQAGTFEPLQGRVCLEGPPSAMFIRGNPNGDGASDLSDAVFILSYLFLGTEKLSCLDTSDVDDSGFVDISDTVFLLGYLFLGGKAPSAPLEGCGVDPTPDAVSCESFSGCP